MSPLYRYSKSGGPPRQDLRSSLLPPTYFTGLHPVPTLRPFSRFPTDYLLRSGLPSGVTSFQDPRPLNSRPSSDTNDSPRSQRIDRGKWKRVSGLYSLWSQWAECTACRQREYYCSYTSRDLLCWRPWLHRLGQEWGVRTGREGGVESVGHPVGEGPRTPPDYTPIICPLRYSGVLPFMKGSIP